MKIYFHLLWVPKGPRTIYEKLYPFSTILQSEFSYSQDDCSYLRLFSGLAPFSHWSIYLTYICALFFAFIIIINVVSMFHLSSCATLSSPFMFSYAVSNQCVNSKKKNLIHDWNFIDIIDQFEEIDALTISCLSNHVFNP